MNLNQRLSRFTLGLLFAAAAGRVDSSDLKDNPYQVIIDRNPFNLRTAPPAVPKAPTTKKKILVDVKLSGITSDGSSKRAWFVIPPGPGRTQPECFDLAEGESDGTLQVSEINEQDGSVTILHDGAQVTLNFRENGLAAPTKSAARLYWEKPLAARFAGNQRTDGPQLNSQRPEPVRPLLVTGRPWPAASRTTGTPTNKLANSFQGWKLPSVRNSGLSQRLVRP
jgi:hypothetical protein